MNGKLHALCVVAAHTEQMRQAEKVIEHLYEDISSVDLRRLSMGVPMLADGYCDDCGGNVEVELNDYDLPWDGVLVEEQEVEDLQRMADDLYTQALIMRIHYENMKIETMEAIRKIEEAPDWLKKWNQLVKSVKAFFTAPLFVEF